MWIRLQVRFHVDDNEPLAKDLLRYGKGPRRLARLLTLATYGLVHLQQRQSPQNGATPLGTSSPPPQRHADETPPEDSSYEYKMSGNDVTDLFGG